MYLVITAAVVVTLFVAELIYSRLSGKRLYGLGDTLTNISATAFEQIFVVLVAVPVYALYQSVYRFRVSEGMPRWLGLIVAVLFVDLAFYWWHRISHRVSVLWSGHAIHHSSEEFNVSVAIRASGWALFTQRLFHLPLALAGVPVEAVIFADAASNIFTLFVHNRVVGKLGPLERILITPSHHRVHHARNPEYLDKNYGGVFIFWDQLFGTYAEEQSPPVYGLVHPYLSLNAAWGRFHVFADIAARARRCRGWKQKLLAPFRPPDWHPPDAPLADESLVQPIRLIAKAHGAAFGYALAQQIVLFLLTAAFIAAATRLSLELRILGALWLWGSIAVVGGLLDGRRWAGWAEGARWCLAGGALFLFLLRG
jgi:sterol desaturase/sphingolipid hydroxylase (fatty acid hydroxylase superfamily)